MKRKRAPVETDPPRNSRLRLILADESRGWGSKPAPGLFFTHRMDRLPMPWKTHAIGWGAAASIFLAASCASNLAGAR